LATPLSSVLSYNDELKKDQWREFAGIYSKHVFYDEQMTFSRPSASSVKELTHKKTGFNYLRSKLCDRLTSTTVIDDKPTNQVT